MCAGGGECGRGPWDKPPSYTPRSTFLDFHPSSFRNPFSFRTCDYGETLLKKDHLTTPSLAYACAYKQCDASPPPPPPPPRRHNKTNERTAKTAFC